MTKQELERRLKVLEQKCCCADEVRVYDTFAGFPAEGNSGNIYLDESTGDLYYWDGDSYESAGGSGGGGEWGSILGVLADQTDLQAELDLKADLASPTFTGTVVLPSTTSIGTITDTELSYVDGLTSSVQTQLNAKQATLVSGTNIKTINSTSLLGSGDIAVSAAAAGSNTHVQYNSSGSLAGNSGFIYDGTAVTVTSSTSELFQVIGTGANPKAKFQGTDPNGEMDIQLVNDRAGFAAYGGFAIGGSTNSGYSLFGLNIGDGLFMYGAGTSLTGMAVGTAGTKPLILGTNSTAIMTFKSSGVVNLAANARQVFADDTAAGVGGLVEGDLYQTSAGVLMVKQ